MAIEDNLKSTIEACLKVPCYLEADTATFPCATVDVFDESPKLCGDGKAVTIVKTVQIDLFYATRSERDTAAATLLQTIKQMPKTSAPDVTRQYDSTAKKHRATFHFEMI